MYEGKVMARHGLMEKEIKENDNEASTSNQDHLLIKWLSIGLLVLLPLILLPAIFLYSRVNRNLDPKNSEQVFMFIPNVLSLKPVDPKRDIYFLDESNLTRAPVTRYPDKIVYKLTHEMTVIRQDTGQLFHPLSGLLFNPIPDLRFDAKSVHIEGHFEGPQSNLVYNVDTGIVYERLLSLCFHEESNQ